MGNIKEINIKNWTYDVLDDIINVENFNPDLLKIGKKSYKKLHLLHWIYHNVNSVNPLCIITGEANGYIKEENGNKYLTFADTNKSFGIRLNVLLKK